MKARFIRSATVVSLWESVRDNLPHYRYGDFSGICDDPSNYFEARVEIADDVAAHLAFPKESKLYEVENCIATYRALSGLTPYQARDERLWVYLSHSQFLEYARRRWPIPEDDDDATKHIRTHFFARNVRQIERDNAVSRLWWMSQLCARVRDVELEKALAALLYRSDVRANLIERPTTAQSVNVFSSIIKKLVSSLDADRALFERTSFRKCMAALNSYGGYILLDVLPETGVIALLDDIIQADIEVPEA